MFSVTSTPFLLNATVRHHHEQHYDTHGDLAAKVLRSIYVDEVVTGSQSKEQTYEFSTGTKNLLQIGVFNLRKLMTNSSTLQARVDIKVISIHPQLV